MVRLGLASHVFAALNRNDDITGWRTPIAVPGARS